jgi:hypothetical protein
LVSETVTTAEKATNGLLNQYYSDHSEAIESATRRLFSDLRRELSSATSSSSEASANALEAAVETFFDDVFPFVYVKMDSGRNLTQAYSDCLRRERRDLRPFGSVPAVQAQVFVQVQKTKGSLRAIILTKVLTVRMMKCTICFCFGQPRTWLYGASKEERREYCFHLLPSPLLLAFPL